MDLPLLCCKPPIPRSQTTFDAQALQNIPLNNGFDTVAELIPGVVSTHAAGFSNTNGDNFSVNGQRGRANNFEIDGQSNNDNTIAGPQSSLAIRTQFRKYR